MIIADPLTVAAIERARACAWRARPRWAELDRLDEDEREELDGLVDAALAHLDAGRWDEARACAEEVSSLAEAAGHGLIWREFGLLVEDAAETGYAG